MNLNSFSFIVFFCGLIVVIIILQILRRKFDNVACSLQLIILLLASYFFILKTDWRFCVCILVITVFSFCLGIKLEKTRSTSVLISGIIALVGFLCYFKYSNFFINSFRAVFGFDSVALNIILPVGVSFYVFSALSYIIDVYKGAFPAEKNFLFFSLFVAFFPKLTAGPIVRGNEFFPQVREYRGIKLDSFVVGIQIFVFGLFKKIVIADHLGVFVDDVFRAPTAFDTETLILAVLSYSLQIYFDFSGYSDMAIGTSKILGFDFKPNFNLPYLAQNESEFWRRWHISLSSWFQEYIYIPLGGNRKSRSRTCINLMIVMVISGLWHGAGWTFITWGAIHGVASCVNKLIGKKMKKLGSLVNTVITFCFISLSWVVFRSESIQKALVIWRGMFTIHEGIHQPYTWSFFAMICLVCASIVAWKKSKGNGNSDKFGRLVVNGFYPVLDLSKFWPLVVFFTMCGLTVVMGYFGNTAFIYGAF